MENLKVNDKEMKFAADLVKSGLKMFHWEKLFPVEYEKDCGLITIGGNLTLYKDMIEVEEVSITGDKKKTVEGWCLDVAYETPPSRWEPGRTSTPPPRRSTTSCAASHPSTATIPSS